MMIPGQYDMFKRDRRRRPKADRAPDPKEFQLQISLIDLLRLQARPEIEYFHVPNGELREKRHAAKLKAMGVLPGVDDLQFTFPPLRPGDPESRVSPTLYLELKARKGRLTSDQEIFRDLVQLQGHNYEWTDSFDDAVRILKKYNVLKGS